MLYSMTAFARSESNTKNLHMIWEVKSVNHRFLESYFRVPEGLRAIETKIRDVTRKKIKRGKIDGFLKLEHQADQSAIKLNHHVLEQLLVSIENVKAKFGTADVSAIEILRWPGLIEDQISQDKELENLAIDLYEEALDKLIEFREREGQQLETIIRLKLDEIDSIVSNIKSDTKNIQLMQKDKLLTRLSELETKVDPERLEQEIALILQKSDITEELDRLSIHVSEGRKIIENTGAHGRRLDFLSQELNRESNTLGAKATTPKLTQQAIDLKVSVEQIREQVQNIE
tara:strand:- start:634 stop:1494 length:861 start_codon:yes stop_codon:yes gene_type:complete